MVRRFPPGEKLWSATPFRNALTGRGADESAWQKEAWEGRWLGGRIKALKGKPPSGCGLKNGCEVAATRRGVKRVRDPAGARGGCGTAATCPHRQVRPGGPTCAATGDQTSQGLPGSDPVVVRRPDGPRWPGSGQTLEGSQI